MDKILAVTINLQDKQISPLTERQIVTSDENYSGLDKVTIEPVTSAIDSNIIPENIKKDISILGVVGSLENSNPVEVATSSEMDALLVADNVGKIYKFVGTSSKYITNAIYIVEEN